MENLMKLKSEGNSQFKTNEFENAIKLYEKVYLELGPIITKHKDEEMKKNKKMLGVHHDELPENFDLMQKLYIDVCNNMVLCYRKLENWDRCIYYSSIVLELEPHNKKAIGRFLEAAIKLNKSYWFMEENLIIYVEELKTGKLKIVDDYYIKHQALFRKQKLFEKQLFLQLFSIQDPKQRCYQYLHTCYEHDMFVAWKKKAMGPILLLFFELGCEGIENDPYERTKYLKFITRKCPKVHELFEIALKNKRWDVIRMIFETNRCDKIRLQDVEIPDYDELFILANEFQFNDLISLKTKK